MVDSWIDCPHCGRNVLAYPKTCSACGKDTTVLPDGSPNPGQENKFLKAMQVGNFIDKAVFIVILAIFGVLFLRFLI